MTRLSATGDATLTVILAGFRTLGSRLHRRDEHPDRACTRDVWQSSAVKRQRDDVAGGDQPTFVQQALVDAGVQDAKRQEAFARLFQEYKMLTSELLDAAERAGVKLILAGNVFAYPEHQSYFDSMIRPRLGRNACFIGAVGGERKAHLLAGARCLLAPSRVPETSSLVAMEAIASGTPVIAWCSGALPEIVSHGRTGFLVNSVEQMADAISRVESIDPSACWGEAEQRFSSKRMTAEYLNLYRSILACTKMPELEAA